MDRTIKLLYAHTLKLAINQKSNQYLYKAFYTLK